MFKKPIYIVLLFPLLLLPFISNDIYAALTEEGIYRIEFDRMAYFIEGKEVSADEFFISIGNIQCDGSGARKTVKINVSIPVYDRFGKVIPGRHLDAVWRIGMPSELIILQDSLGIKQESSRRYGTSTTCSPY